MIKIIIHYFKDMSKSPWDNYLCSIHTIMCNRKPKTKRIMEYNKLWVQFCLGCFELYHVLSLIVTSLPTLSLMYL